MEKFYHRFDCGYEAVRMVRSNGRTDKQGRLESALRMQRWYQKKTSRWDSKEIYRSSLLYDPNSGLLRVWYSAFRESKIKEDQTWHVGYTHKIFPVQ
jgi:hypothetical protein